MNYTFTGFRAADNALKPLLAEWLRQGRQLALDYIQDILDQFGWTEWLHTSSLWELDRRTEGDSLAHAVLYREDLEGEPSIEQAGVLNLLEVARKKWDAMPSPPVAGTTKLEQLPPEERVLLRGLLDHPLFRFKAYLDDKNAIQVDWIEPP